MTPLRTTISKVSAAALSAALSVCAAFSAYGDVTNIVVAPLCKAMWNQGRHFNRMCPVTSSVSCPDGRMWAGCTAVAVSMLMKHYEWPREGEMWFQDWNDEKSWANDPNAIGLRAHFHSPYNWEAMKNAYGHISDASSSLAVAQLVADVGAKLNTEYTSGGSRAIFSTVPAILVNNFSYENVDFHHVENGAFTAEVEARLQEQLAAGHPVLCSGKAGVSGTGHTYICDGYARVDLADGSAQNLYHFNFGWGGMSNGWFPLNAVNTSAVPGEEAASHPVNEMVLGLFPKKSPQLLSAPASSGPDVNLGWAMAACWTNSLAGFRVERQETVNVPVDLDLSSSWSVRSSGWGWGTADGLPYAVVVPPLWGSGVNWPTMGVNANTTTGVAVSASSVVTIRYKARKFPSGVTLALIKSNSEGSDLDETTWEDYPVLASLPGGTSTSSFTEKTVTVSGSVLASAFGSEPAIFALRFRSSGTDSTYSANTEVFRLISFTVTGEGSAWETKESRLLPPSARSCTLDSQPAGAHKYVVTALYPEAEASASAEKRILASAPSAPAISLSRSEGRLLEFTVSGTSAFTYEFDTQSNALMGSPSKNGNKLTYTFNNDVAGAGTHWLALTVTDTAGGGKAKYIHITNPPASHPLVPYTEGSVSAAVERARREGKLVLLLSSGDPDSVRFSGFAGVLASNEVVAAVSSRYIVVELLTSLPEDREECGRYWRGQPQVGYGQGLTGFAPERTAYAIVVDPSDPTSPYPCDRLPDSYMSANSYWNYFNSQYDIANFYVPAQTTAGLVRFLGQSGFGAARPVITSVSVNGSVMEIAIANAESGRRYRLLSATSPSGPFAPVAGSETKAGASGFLLLRTMISGSALFFKVEAL